MNADSENALNYAISEGIIDMEQICREYDVKKKIEYLSLHPNAIYQGKDGNYYTYVGEGRKDRRKVKRTSKESLENYLVKYYYDKENDPTIIEVFNKWIYWKYDLNHEISQQTYTKYQNEYKRFFMNNKDAVEICSKPLRNISENELDTFLRLTIANMKLTRKAYSGLKIILKGIFRYAKKYGYTDLSISHFLGDMEISNNAFTTRVKSIEEQVFSENEINTAISYLRKSNDIRDLAILLLFETGLRLGELAVLKPEDVLSDSILVRRTEIKYNDENGNNVVDVQEMPKTEAGYREVFVGKKGMNTLKKIMRMSKGNEYLFMENNQRIREHGHRKHLYRICDKLSITRKSPHKIRHTYGTMLIDSGTVDDSVIMEQMGHKNIETTRKYYYFSNKNLETKRSQIRKAVNI